MTSLSVLIGNNCFCILAAFVHLVSTMDLPADSAQLQGSGPIDDIKDVQIPNDNAGKIKSESEQNSQDDDSSDMKESIQSDQSVSNSATVGSEVPKSDSSVDPYAYLDRDFTSEKYKVEIRNLPKYYGFGVISFQYLLKCSQYLFIQVSDITVKFHVCVVIQVSIRFLGTETSSDRYLKAGVYKSEAA